MKKIVFIVAVISFSFLTMLSNSRLFAEGLTYPELIERMKKAEDVKDATFTLMTRMIKNNTEPGTANEVKVYVKGKLYKTISTKPDMIMVSEKDGIYSYIKRPDNKITKMRNPGPSWEGGWGLPDFQNEIKTVGKESEMKIEDIVEDGHAYYRLSFPANNHLVQYWVDGVTFWPVKYQLFAGEKLTMEMIWKDVVANTGLDDKLFTADIPEGQEVQEINIQDLMKTFNAEIESVEILNAGYINAQDVTKQNMKKGCPLFLFKPQLINESSQVPGQLLTAFGIVVKAHGAPKDGLAKAKMRFFHPPITDPDKGDVTTEFEAETIISIDRPQIIGWSFEYDWEIVPGEWRVEVLKDDKILASKTFEVVAVDNIYAGAGPDAEQLSKYRAALEKNPDDVGMLLGVGHAMCDLGRMDEALAIYTRTIEIAPGCSSCYNSRCRAYNMVGDYEKSLIDCDKALELRPNYTFAKINRANIFLDQGQYKQAIDEYTTALTWDPSSHFAYYNRSLAYDRSGNKEQANYDCWMAKTIEPGLYDCENPRPTDLNVEVLKLPSTRNPDVPLLFKMTEANKEKKLLLLAFLLFLLLLLRRQARTTGVH